MLIRILWLILILSVVNAALRFVRGMRHGLNRPATRPGFPSERRTMHIDESDIIDANFTDISDTADRDDPGGRRDTAADGRR